METTAIGADSKTSGISGIEAEIKWTHQEIDTLGELVSELEEAMHPVLKKPSPVIAEGPNDETITLGPDAVASPELSPISESIRSCKKRIGTLIHRIRRITERVDL